ncbi:GNAT family N-acetyltransferase [Leuconostoc gasicomitatum]|uniref:GNAT family N-acetyltransferase n=1 Tax=Leuconostoc gasicomitatum TaxID=115778 RepID=UPI000BD6721D|nr:GNAT family N-acetyltransferase [Leuconostoc gasicomitatum]MBZ5944556.1 GNAT family N-acetyltransferase [Leuconostoc gasicomitatum]MBZ5946840.1 GNAT family N-acetyltransferase [Leuconostoc gasicomitatum]MBZ5950552.1 GNAT family N-acetyltransferase [Leuconostoc gasicomitatum]MBZ5950598.1 GNAT family N-acetyltransferase [Leuconostoc gasicomitatum]MBZ5960769.1 GNAT family N-acetyltransferase [Leuconostoc gasicomitatum]
MISYKETKELSNNDLKKLYLSVQWFAYTDDMGTLKQAISNSLAVVSAWDNDKLVGLTRVVGDGSTIIYVQDLLVHPEYQNKRIGTIMLSMILDKYKQVRQKVLLTDDEPIVRNFYENNGFISADQGNTVAFYKFL